MEHCDLFAVFDGHSGSGVVRHTVEVLPTKIQEALKAAGPDILSNVTLLQVLLKRVFIEHDKELARISHKIKDSGSTATVAIITPTHVVVAYIGDSPCFLMNPNSGLILPGGEMGKHEPSLASETERIQRAGGSVEIDEMGVPRVDGLMVSRAFGDFPLKYSDPENPPYDSDWTQMKVTAHPDIVVWERPEIGLLALMSDGLVETNTNALKPLPRVAIDIFNALKIRSYDLHTTCITVVANHVKTSVGTAVEDYDGDDLSIILVDVGKSGVLHAPGAQPSVQAVLNANVRPKSRKMKGGRKNKTGKKHRIIKMFMC